MVIIVGSIKTRKDKDGYLIVGLTNLNGTLTTARVHRMVAETFIPNPSNCPVVNHKDNIKDNNDVSNLEWVTISYNTKHGYHIGASVSKASKIIKSLISKWRVVQLLWLMFKDG